MRKVEKGVAAGKIEAKPVVRPTKPAVHRQEPAPMPAIPPALARALAHAAASAPPAQALASERASDSISAVKIFWATFGEHRNAMGERISDWLRQHQELKVVDCLVTQSADSGFHCLTVTLFLSGDPTNYLADVPAPRW